MRPEIIVYEENGQIFYKGLFDENVDVPTGGSISIKIAEDKYVSILVSEWAVLRFGLKTHASKS